MSLSCIAKQRKSTGSPASCPSASAAVSTPTAWMPFLEKSETKMLRIMREGSTIRALMALLRSWMDSRKLSPTRTNMASFRCVRGHAAQVG